MSTGNWFYDNMRHVGRHARRLPPSMTQRANANASKPTICALAMVHPIAQSAAAHPESLTEAEAR